MMSSTEENIITEMIDDRIKAKRKELGLTQSALAEKLNVTDRAVIKREQNEGNNNNAGGNPL